MKTRLYVPHFSWSKVTSSLARYSRCMVQIDSCLSGANPGFFFGGGGPIFDSEILKRTDHLRVPSQNYIFFKYAWNLMVPKGTARFNKKINQLNRDMRSYECKTFRVKQVLKKQTQDWWGRVRTPPRPSPWICHCTSNGYGDWQATTHKLVLKPKVCFRVINLMKLQRSVGMAIPNLKCKIKSKSVKSLPI